MAAAPGTRPPNAGVGRRKGVPNKLTAELKDMILGALEAKGGQAYLEQQADANPTAFLSLLGRVLPRQIDATVEGHFSGYTALPIPVEERDSDRRQPIQIPVEEREGVPPRDARGNGNGSVR